MEAQREVWEYRFKDGGILHDMYPPGNHWQEISGCWTKKKDICMESGVITEGSLSGVLEGRNTTGL